MRKWLKDIRELKKLSQEYVANKADISQNFYCDIENGKRRPSPEVAKKIADVLGFDWTKFYEEEKGA